MIICLDWIKDFVNIDGIDFTELCDRLTMAGFEVENAYELPKVNGVVTAKIISKGIHPNAGKLSVYKVFDGRNFYQIVSGADNIFEGAVVPYATPGTKLKGQITVSKRNIRGIESEGMILSAEELGFNEKSEGIMVFPDITKAGTDINQLVGFPDYVMDISITPNRGDCLSIRGLAREIAAMYERNFDDIRFNIDEDLESAEDYSSIYIENESCCPSYMGRVIKGVTVADSPSWLQARLMKVGVNPINNVVDISNYILYECGQPLHAFDLDKIGNRVIVRNAKKNEKIITLDGADKVLQEGMLVISNSNKAIAIAGIMGGKDSAISRETNNIFIECAYFNPTSIRTSAKKLNMQTDASYRFERGIDRKEIRHMVDYAGYMIHNVAGGRILKNAVSDKRDSFLEKNIFVSFDKINQLLGTNISHSAMKNILERLNFQLENDVDGYNVLIPSYRTDISRWADIAEEVARLYGYENIGNKTTAMVNDTKETLSLDREISNLKQICRSLGFNEAINYSFINDNYLLNFDDKKEIVYVKNPLNEEFNVLRTYIFPSILSNIQYNKNQGLKNIRFFEEGVVFKKSVTLGSNFPVQRHHLSLGSGSDFWPLSWHKQNKGEVFYLFKGVLESISSFYGVQNKYVRSKRVFLHPGKSADIVCVGGIIGFFGELNPVLSVKLGFHEPFYIAELFLDDFICLSKKREYFYKKYSSYPYIYKDISIVMDDHIASENITNVINSSNELIKDVVLFDIYKDDKLGNAKVSLTYRIYFLHSSKTLTDEEINPILSVIIKKLNKEFGAILR